MWRQPLAEQYEADIKSNIADVVRDRMCVCVCVCVY